jgi:FKBP-type peptidyl-prolyl cis-trans isomerase SlpA
MTTTFPFPIGPGTRVRMHFALSLTDGTVAYSSFNEEPLEFEWGDGTLRPGLELAVLGLKAGDEQTLTLLPEQAYGLHDAALVHDMPRSDFPDLVEPKVGQLIAFESPTGEETAGAILAVDADSVRVDFNHPLAGREVVFRVKILSVVPQNPGAGS